MDHSFAKLLSKNDTGETTGHQSAIAIPKKNGEVLAFFPHLPDYPDRNPECTLTCVDQDGTEWELRYIWYNGKRHGRSTRDEYRLCKTTPLLKSWNARSGDEIVFRSTSDPSRFLVSLLRHRSTGVEPHAPENPEANDPEVIYLTGWRKVY